MTFVQDKNKTKPQLLSELAALRQHVAELETLETESLSATAEGKLYREALKASETRYRRLFEAAQDGILILDAGTGQITDVNPFLTDLLGYSHVELVGKTLWEIGPFKNVEASRLAFAELQSKTYIRYEDLPLETRDGRRIDVEFVSNIYLVDDKRVIQCNIRDITARKQGEKSIQLRLLFEFAAEHSLEELMQKALDEIGQITGSPLGFYHLVEADQETLSHQVWSTRTQQEFCAAEGKGKHYSIEEAGVWADCVRQRKPVIHNDCATLHHCKGMPEGHAKVVRELVVPTLRGDRIVSILGVGNKPSDYDEKDVELMAYVADVVWTIVERKQAQEALRHYAEQLAAQNTELDAFAHTVAHDLKSSLGIITGFAKLLVCRYETMSPEDIAEALGYVFRTGEKLDTIIEELMLLTGVRKQEVIPEPLDMNSIVREAINRLQMLIQDQQAQITLPDEAAWPEALGYAPWIEEVWANYISNAITYGGRPPHVELGATMQTDNKIRFWVWDNGPGLNVEAQAKLFTPFTQLSQVRANGHGLGLSIVRRIVEKLGGQVGIETELGQGSTFFFTLPVGNGHSPELALTDSHFSFPAPSSNRLPVNVSSERGPR
jgi:PAS domain S-box-containing protein